MEDINNIALKKKAELATIQMPDSYLMQLADRISEEVNKAKRSLAININTTLTETYWNVGRYIVEFEQEGNAKARYGTSLLTRFSKLLRSQIGRGYSRPYLNNMRKFF